MSNQPEAARASVGDMFLAGLYARAEEEIIPAHPDYDPEQGLGRFLAQVGQAETAGSTASRATRRPSGPESASQTDRSPAACGNCGSAVDEAEEYCAVCGTARPVAVGIYAAADLWSQTLLPATVRRSAGARDDSGPGQAGYGYGRGRAAWPDPATEAGGGPGGRDVVPERSPAPPVGTGPADSGQPDPRSQAAGAAKRKDPRRQAHLTLSRVEPWSVMKFSFLAAVAGLIVLLTAVAVLYPALSGLGVLTSLQHALTSLTSSKAQAGTSASHWFTWSRVLGYTAMLGALNIVLITAISTVGSVIYNLIAKTIGGIEVTLRETD